MHESSAPSGWTRAFGIGVLVLVIAIVIQFFLAGLGIFAGARFFFLHAVVDASLIFFGALVVLALGWRAHAGKRSLQLTGAIPALVVLQSLLLIPYRMDGPPLLRAISALHVVNGLAIFWVGAVLLQRVRGARATP